MPRFALLLVVVPASVASAVWAQDVTITQPPAQAPQAAASDPDAARYAMRATDEGTLRLDTRTGAVSLCTTTGGRLKCAVGADERAAYTSEIDRLAQRVEALEGRMAALEGPVGEGPAASEALTAEEERQIDRAVGTAERALRGFAGIVKRLRRDLEAN